MIGSSFRRIGNTPGIDGGFVSSREGESWGDGQFTNAGTGFAHQVVDEIGHGSDTLSVGILGNSSLEFTIDDHGADLIGTVETEDGDLLASLFDSHGSADGTTFIAGKDDLNVGIGGDHVRGSGQGGVLFFSGLVGNDFIVNASVFQTSFETTVAQFGFFGFLVIVVNDADLDGAGQAAVFDVFGSSIAHGFAIGGVIAHVTTGDEGNIGETTGIGEGNGDTLVIGLFQSGHGNGGA